MAPDPKFIAAHKRMETRTRGITAAIIIDPSDPRRFGRVVLTTSRTGGRVSAVAWPPGPTHPDNGREFRRHARHADGYGYDKHSAAMSGAVFYNLKKGEPDTLKDAGHSWRHQLEDAGYIVAEAC